MIRIFFRGFSEGFKDFGKLVNTVVIFISLIIVYFLGIGLTSIVGKLSRKRFLELKKDEKAQTYWTDNRIEKKKHKEEYYRTF